MTTEALNGPERPGELRAALLGNVETMIAFRVGVHNAEFLEDHFETVGGQALAEQPNYHAYVRLLVEGRLTPPFSSGRSWSRRRVASGPASGSLWGCTNMSAQGSRWKGRSPKGCHHGEVELCLTS